MRVFLSWSGDRSKRIAEALRDWLPSVVQAIEPWLSSTDIPLGARWAVEVGEALQETDAGVICLTRENLQAGWLNFEAGAISNVSRKTLVCVYSLDDEPQAITGPLSIFQCTRATRAGTLNLLASLNNVGQHLTAPQVEKSFERWWPDLQTRLAEISAASLSPADPAATIDEKLDEILALLRARAAGTGADASRAEQNMPEPPLRSSVLTTSDRPRVFIASSTEGLDIARALEFVLHDSVATTVWYEGVFGLGEYTYATLVDAVARQDFAIIVLTADDVTAQRGSRTDILRDNLLFQLGLFTGALGRARTFLICEPDSQDQLPADLLGVTTVIYRKRSGAELLEELRPVCLRILRAMGAA